MFKKSVHGHYFLLAGLGAHAVEMIVMALLPAIEPFPCGQGAFLKRTTLFGSALVTYLVTFAVRTLGYVSFLSFHLAVLRRFKR